jgi:hypothetical protein
MTKTLLFSFILCLTMAAAMVGSGLPHAGHACLLCIWDDLTSRVQLIAAILTSLDAILGLILGRVGERIGGSFGRGFGRGLGERVDDVASVVSGGVGSLKPVHEIVHDHLMDQVKEGAMDEIIDHLFGDEATREQMATDAVKGLL